MARNPTPRKTARWVFWLSRKVNRGHSAIFAFDFIFGSMAPLFSWNRLWQGAPVVNEFNALELSGVGFAYGKRPVLRQVDLAVKSGGFLGLLGPNGSGKTTLIRILSGTLRASSGTVKLMGTDIGSWDRQKLAQVVAVVPQK